MLILSRRTGEKILFPSLGISVEITWVRGKSATVGVKAPDGVKILRGEISDLLEQNITSVRELESAHLNTSTERTVDGSGTPKHSSGKASLIQSVHDIRNHMNSIVLGLHVILRQAELNQEVDRNVLQQSISELHLLEEACKATVPSQKIQKVRLSDRSALIVDDNENESSLLTGFLRNFDFRVASAVDGHCAINYLKLCSKLPDVVLLDMNMPNLNGQETVNRIRRDDELKNLRLFAVSGCSPEDVGLKIGPEGVNRWFQKPIRPDQLVDFMQKDIAA